MVHVVSNKGTKPYPVPRGYPQRMRNWRMRRAALPRPAKPGVKPHRTAPHRTARLCFLPRRAGGVACWDSIHSTVTDPAGETDGCPEWRHATAGTFGRRFQQANKVGRSGPKRASAVTSICAWPWPWPRTASLILWLMGLVSLEPSLPLFLLAHCQDCFTCKKGRRLL